MKCHARSSGEGQERRDKVGGPGGGKGVLLATLDKAKYNSVTVLSVHLRSMTWI